MQQGKRVILVNPKGEVLETFDSVSQASQMTGVSLDSIIKRCKHRMIHDEYILQDLLHKYSFFTFRYDGDTDRIQHRPKRKYMKVVLIDRSGKVLAEYKDQREAARKTGFTENFVTRRVRGYAAREFDEWDYSFRLVEDDNPTESSTKSFI